jgi:hypothetical protein
MTVNSQPSDASQLRTAAGRLSDRGIDPQQVIGDDPSSGFTTADLYLMLGMVAASEKAGQGPTHGLARLALRAGLSTEVSDALFLAYNQQSAEEAGHGDKVFGNAYYAMGGVAPTSAQSIVGDGSSLPIGSDPRQNKQTLGTLAGALGGIEVVALQRVFPDLVALCERWQHPIARDLLAQIRDVVRPEESRHVLIWRYVFHQLIAPKGDQVIGYFLQNTNMGRSQLGAPALDRGSFMRLLGPAAPTMRQLMGKERVVFE